MKHTAIIPAMLATAPAAWSRNEISCEEHDGFTLVKPTEGHINDRRTISYSHKNNTK